ncbi:uncharacterized protein LOC144734811 [Lampetra planeri]
MVPGRGCEVRAGVAEKKTRKRRRRRNDEEKEAEQKETEEAPDGKAAQEKKKVRKLKKIKVKNDHGDRDGDGQEEPAPDFTWYEKENGDPGAAGEQPSTDPGAEVAEPLSVGTAVGPRRGGRGARDAAAAAGDDHDTEAEVLPGERRGGERDGADTRIAGTSPAGSSARDAGRGAGGSPRGDGPVAGDSEHIRPGGGRGEPWENRSPSPASVAEARGDRTAVESAARGPRIPPEAPADAPVLAASGGGVADASARLRRPQRRPQPSVGPSSRRAAIRCGGRTGGGSPATDDGGAGAASLESAQLEAGEEEDKPGKEEGEKEEDGKCPTNARTPEKDVVARQIAVAAPAESVEGSCATGSAATVVEANRPEAGRSDVVCGAVEAGGEGSGSQNVHGDGNGGDDEGTTAKHETRRHEAQGDVADSQAVAESDDACSSRPGLQATAEASEDFVQGRSGAASGVASGSAETDAVPTHTAEAGGKGGGRSRPQKPRPNITGCRAIGTRGRGSRQRMPATVGRRRGGQAAGIGDDPVATTPGSSSDDRRDEPADGASLRGEMTAPVGLSGAGVNAAGSVVGPGGLAPPDAGGVCEPRRESFSVAEARRSGGSLEFSTNGGEVRDVSGSAERDRKQQREQRQQQQGEQQQVEQQQGEQQVEQQEEEQQQGEQQQVEQQGEQQVEQQQVEQQQVEQQQEEQQQGEQQQVEQQGEQQQREQQQGEQQQVEQQQVEQQQGEQQQGEQQRGEQHQGQQQRGEQHQGEQQGQQQQGEQQRGEQQQGEQQQQVEQQQRGEQQGQQQQQKQQQRQQQQGEQRHDRDVETVNSPEPCHSPLTSREPASRGHRRQDATGWEMPGSAATPGRDELGIPDPPVAVTIAGAWGGEAAHADACGRQSVGDLDVAVATEQGGDASRTSGRVPSDAAGDAAGEAQRSRSPRPKTNIGAAGSGATRADRRLLREAADRGGIVAQRLRASSRDAGAVGPGGQKERPEGSAAAAPAATAAGAWVVAAAEVLPGASEDAGWKAAAVKRSEAKPERAGDALERSGGGDGTSSSTGLREAPVEAAGGAAWLRPNAGAARGRAARCLANPTETAQDEAPWRRDVAARERGADDDADDDAPADVGRRKAPAPAEEAPAFFTLTLFEIPRSIYATGAPRPAGAGEAAGGAATAPAGRGADAEREEEEDAAVMGGGEAASGLEAEVPRCAGDPTEQGAPPWDSMAPPPLTSSPRPGRARCSSDDAREEEEEEEEEEERGAQSGSTEERAPRLDREANPDDSRARRGGTTVAAAAVVLDDEVDEVEEVEEVKEVKEVVEVQEMVEVVEVVEVVVEVKEVEEEVAVKQEEVAVKQVEVEEVKQVKQVEEEVEVEEVKAVAGRKSTPRGGKRDRDAGALGKRTMALKRGGGEPEEEEEAGVGRVPDAPVKRPRRGPGRRCRDEGVPARRGEAETGAGERDPSSAAPVASGQEGKRRSAGRRAQGGEVERAKGWRRVRLGNSAEETRGGRAEEEDEVERPLVSGDDGHGGDGEHVAGTRATASPEAQTSRYRPGVRSPSSPPAQGIGAPRLGASGIAGAASPSMSSDTDPDALTTFTIEDIFMEVQ